MKVIHIVLQDLVHVGFRVQLNAVWICILRYMNAVPYLLCTPSLSQLDGELMLAVIALTSREECKCIQADFDSC